MTRKSRQAVSVRATNDSRLGILLLAYPDLVPTEGHQTQVWTDGVKQTESQMTRKAFRSPLAGRLRPRPSQGGRLT